MLGDACAVVVLAVEPAGIKLIQSRSPLGLGSFRRRTQAGARWPDAILRD
jgi:hypothetical protein